MSTLQVIMRDCLSKNISCKNINSNLNLTYLVHTTKEKVINEYEWPKIMFTNE